MACTIHTEKKMKVCIATTAFPRWFGDHHGTFVYQAARAIQNQGLQVRVIAMHSPGSKGSEIWDGMEITRPRYLPEKWEILRRETAGIPAIWKKQPLARPVLVPFIIAHSLALARHARDCDIIHANWTLSAFAAFLGTFHHRKPYVVTVQGSDILQAPKTPFVGSITKIILNQAGRVLALSNALAESTLRLGVRPDKVSIIPNGVDTAFFCPKSSLREPVILYIGSFIERKGLTYLIDAIPHVVEQFPQISFVFIGGGSQEKLLSDHIHALGLEEKIQLLGELPPRNVRDWLQKAQIFVLPSLEEGLGVALLEALSCGTPVVATQVGGILDVITPEVGTLVPPADAEALAAALLEILRNPIHWHELSQHARQRALQRYDWSNIAKQIVSIYKEQLD